ncbi:hypothetical protein C0Q70_02995 [Pomacea canaliculata]|uniref:Uncharacterized protein n=1 Tax=Pomacea canaliculata TaxID=400727 RepID=A0A2T7PRI2_POMCA|nr:hypothetical protein C0Q70_02995 [Pomacea canaliculata]
MLRRLRMRYVELQSVTRGCLPTSATSSEVCGDTDRRTCLLQCKTNMCNVESNADLAKIYISSSGNLSNSVPATIVLQLVTRHDQGVTAHFIEDRQAVHVSPCSQHVADLWGVLCVRLLHGPVLSTVSSRGKQTLPGVHSFSPACLSNIGELMAKRLSEAQTKCVACSYQMAGDGTTDYACVNDSLRHTHSTNITCNFTTHSCVIKAVYRYEGLNVTGQYDEGSGRRLNRNRSDNTTRSVTRSCLPASATSSEVCGYTDRRTCLLECKTNMCNAESNADLAKIYISSSEAQNKCVACSYNFAGDGTVDYACVNDSIRHTTSSNITCDFTTHSCVIKALLFKAKQHKSVTRDCLPTSATSLEVCGYTDRRTCLLECKTHMCNAESNADLAKIYISSSEAQNKCVACTYQMAGDGTVDYACVNDPLSHKLSSNITCDFTTHSCVIKASVTRGCLPTSATSSEVCGNTDRRTCLLECKTNMCNAESNADLAKIYIRSSEAQNKCVACSYQMAGDGTVDYACVNDPLSHKLSSNITCDFTTYSCVTKASVTRDCLPPSATSSEVCGYTDRRTCLLECKTNMCNVESNADLAKIYISSSDNLSNSVPAMTIT